MKKMNRVDIQMVRNARFVSMKNVINKKIFLFLSIFLTCSIFAQKPIIGSLIDGIDLDTSI